MAVDPTNILGTGELKPPPGLTVETPEQKDLYRAALEFERFFLQHMMKGMQSATKAIGGGGDEAGESGSAGMSVYNDMAQDQMVQSMLDGGGLGMASTLYQQMGEATGLVSPQRGTSGGQPAPTHQIQHRIGGGGR